MLTLFLKTIRLLLPFVANALVAACTLFFAGLILALLRKTGPPAWLLLPWLPLPFPFPFFEVVAELPFCPASFPPFEPCFNPHELHSISPCTPFLHSVEVVTLHELQTGFMPNGISEPRILRNYPVFEVGWRCEMSTKAEVGNCLVCIFVNARSIS